YEDTKIRFLLSGSCPVQPPKAPTSNTSLYLCASVLRYEQSAWQLDRELRPARYILARLDGTAVLRHDAADDRESQAASAPFGRIIRHEEFLAFRRCAAWAVFRHRQPHHSRR